MFQFKVATTDVKSKSDSSLCSESSTDSNVSVDTVVNAFCIGDRVRCEDHVGTVKYIGSIAPYEGAWLGIEWDDPSRGKHDGTVNGIQYFTTTKPNAASFVRPNKVLKCKKITEAIRERYGYDPNVIRNLEDIGGGLERKRIDYSQLKVVDVSARQVSDLDQPGVLADLCPKVEFVNLADNLISEWDSIGQLCVGLKQLKMLDISGNPLESVPESLNEVLRSVFQKLEHVILGKVNYDWEEVMKASVMWKNIRNLQVPYNKIVKLSPPVTVQNLTSLDLGGNQICDWEDILKLNILENLEYLSVFGNRISSIRFPPDQGTGDDSKGKEVSIFPSLVRLNVSENRIADWQSVSELNKLTKLRELRIDTNPFLDGDTRTNNRQMIIARIGRLEKLDGVDITKQERRDAELDYVKKYSSHWNSMKEKDAFLAEHTRYFHLVKLYGQSEEGEVDRKVETLQTSMINIHIVPENGSQVPITKKLMKTMTVQKLKMLLQRIFKVPGAQLEIKLVSSRNPSISYIMDNEFFDLSQYSIEDGDTLYVKW